MRREIHKWWSPNLNKEMEIVVYGHYGYALLMFPTAAADYLEYERFQLIDSIAPFINDGKLKAFSVNSINSESWLNNNMHPSHKAIRHQQGSNTIYQTARFFLHPYHYYRGVIRSFTCSKFIPAQSVYFCRNCCYER